MKISKQELKRVFETVGRAVDGEDEGLAYIEFYRENDDVVAIACNAYLLLKTKVNAEFSEDLSFYLKPFKIDKKAVDDYEINAENGKTIIKDGDNIFTQPIPISFPNLKNLDSFVAREHFEAKVCLNKEDLKALVASAQKSVKFYLTNEPNKMVKVKVDDNVDGLMTPIKWTEDE